MMPSEKLSVPSSCSPTVLSVPPCIERVLVELIEMPELALTVPPGPTSRVATPIGPLSVDFAVPLNRRDPGATDPQFHFAVGAF